MEQSQRGVSKDYSVLICGLDTLCVHYTSTWSSEIFHPTLPSTVNIVREWEERVTRTCYSLELVRPFFFLNIGQAFYLTFEEALPLFLFSALKSFSANKKIDRIGLFRTLDTFLER